MVFTATTSQQTPLSTQGDQRIRTIENPLNSKFACTLHSHIANIQRSFRYSGYNWVASLWIVDVDPEDLVWISTVIVVTVLALFIAIITTVIYVIHKRDFCRVCRGSKYRWSSYNWWCIMQSMITVIIIVYLHSLVICLFLNQMQNVSVKQLQMWCQFLWCF